MFVIVQWHTIFILLVLPLGCFGDYIVIHPKLMKQGKLHCLLEKKPKFYIGKRHGYVTDMEQKYTPKDKHCVLNIHVL